MQYMIDLAENAKIPDYLVHELPFKWVMTQKLISKFRTPAVQFQNLQVFSINFWQSSAYHFDAWYVQTERFDCRSLRESEEDKFARIIFYCSDTYKSSIQISFLTGSSYDTSSEWPAQKPQILRKCLRICQLFNVLPQRPQGQRPNSITLIW